MNAVGLNIWGRGRYGAGWRTELGMHRSRGALHVGQGHESRKGVVCQTRMEQRT